MRELLTRLLHAPFLENHRPDWLFGMELDFYFEDLKLAVEFQGGQHFTPVHGYRNLFDQRRRDTAKKRICKERGIALLRIEANDLLYGKMRFKLKRLGLKYALKPAPKNSKAFKKGVEYRAMLKRAFNCPTAFRKGSEGRKLAFQDAYSRQ
jgi:hypothetical protein